MNRLWFEIKDKANQSSRFFGVIVIIGLLHGLVYVFVLPPWWHHDEPGHFQVAWFLANHGKWPAIGETDNAMQTALTKSLDKYHLLDYINYHPGKGGELPEWVLALQRRDPPVYYMVAAVPLSILRGTDLALQNRALRLLSLGFFLLILWICWELGGELFGESHPIQRLTTFTLALLPGFVNQMTAISDEPLATLFFSIFLLAGVRLIRHKFSWKQLTLLVGSALAGYFTNNIIWISLTVLGFVLFSILVLPKYIRIGLWSVIVVASLGLLFSVLNRGDALYWYKDRITTEYSQKKDERAPVGQYALQTDVGVTLHQRLSQDAVKSLQTHTLTLGFWAWATQPIKVQSPQVTFLSNGINIGQKPEIIELNTKPAFFSLPIIVPSNFSDPILLIDPAGGGPVITNIQIFWDGLLLVDGKRSGVPPQFSGPDALTGTWDGVKFDNLIRNGSAETTSFQFSPWLLSLGEKYAPDYFLSSVLPSLQDWPGSGLYFKQTISLLNDTFWGKMGPSNIPILGAPYIYQLLFCLFILSLFGAATWALKLRRELNWSVIFFLGLSMLLIWGQTIFRGIGTLDTPSPVTPWSRYSLPVFIPTVALFCAGGFAVLNFIKRKLSIGDIPIESILIIAIMACLSIFAILTMVQFFHWKTDWPYSVMFLLLIGSTAAAYSFAWVALKNRQS